jgi:hypothetical protein
MPLAPPVTIATRPSNRCGMGGLTSGAMAASSGADAAIVADRRERAGCPVARVTERRAGGSS